jgi:hypothetical protein
MRRHNGRCGGNIRASDKIPFAQEHSIVGMCRVVPYVVDGPPAGDHWNIDEHVAQAESAPTCSLSVGA